MGINIFDGGASIRIVRGSKTLLVNKEQIKAIDTIHDAIVRIDIGEGPLRNIFLDYREVNQPEVGGSEDLRDIINQMLTARSGSGDGSGCNCTCGDASESGQMMIYKQLESIGLGVGALLSIAKDILRTKPTIIDEGNSEMIYRGWHSKQGITNNPEWAIERIRRVEGIVYCEWAFGTKQQIYSWEARETYNYALVDYTRPDIIPMDN
ncbi:MAG: hypothetical protein EOO15_00280 [Chitinophagaceae bacterium]|nr:MAG: hypothetical protein EOO15_00280 [Chitinophagaceae bacterium]